MEPLLVYCSLPAGRYFLLLNPDTVILKGSLEAMSGFLDTHPDAGAVAPRYLNPDRSFQKFYCRFPTFLLFLIKYTFFFHLVPAKLRDKVFKGYNYEKEGDEFAGVKIIEQPASSCLLLKKAIFSGPLFDDAFPLFFNDVDLCRRIYGLFYNAYFLPEAEIIHSQGQSVKKFSEDYEPEYVVSWLRYIRKYDGWLVFILAEAVLSLHYILFSISNVFGVFLFKKSRKELMKNFVRRSRIILCRSQLK